MSESDGGLFGFIPLGLAEFPQGTQVTYSVSDISHSEIHLIIYEYRQLPL